MNRLGQCACLNVICVGLAGLSLVGCGGDDDNGKSASPASSADGGTGTLDLTGVWITNDFACRSAKRRESVQIDQFELKVTGTKVEGDDCVPAGYVAFEGKLPRANLTEADLPISFSFKLYDGTPGDPKSIEVVENGTAKITSFDTVVLSLANAQLHFSRTNAAASGGPAADGGKAGSGMSLGASGAGGRAATAGRGGSRAAAGRGGASGASDEEEEMGAAGRRTRANTGASGSGGSSDDSAGGAAGSDEAPPHDSDDSDDSEPEPDDSEPSEAGSGGRGGASGRAGASGAAGSRAPEECEGPILPGASCDHVAQCGCEAGESCRFDDATPPQCFPAGPNVKGETCDADSECGPGLICVEHLCLPQCRVKDDCAGSCEDVTLSDAPVDGLKVCVDPCQPLLPASCFRSPRPTSGTCNPCKAGASCLPAPEFGFATCTVSEFPTLRDPGQTCTSQGAQCYGGGCLEETCRAWCDDDLDCADATETCEKGHGFNAALGVELGLCVPAS